jgi:hypothetical protein
MDILSTPGRGVLGRRRFKFFFKGTGEKICDGLLLYDDTTQ